MTSPGLISLAATMYLPTYSDFLILYKTSVAWSKDVTSLFLIYDPILIQLYHSLTRMHYKMTIAPQAAQLFDYN